MIQRFRIIRDEREGGFTLIELLIVIVILGILAGIVVFAVGGITDRGDKSACKSDFKSVEVAQEAKKAQSGSYAASVTALVPDFLRSAPSSTKYTIATSTSNNGAVTVTVGAGAGATTGGIATCDSA